MSRSETGYNPRIDPVRISSVGLPIIPVKKKIVAIGRYCGAVFTSPGVDLRPHIDGPGPASAIQSKYNIKVSLIPTDIPWMIPAGDDHVALVGSHEHIAFGFHRFVHGIHIFRGLVGAIS